MIFLFFVSFTGWVLWYICSFFLYRYTSVAGKTVLVTGGCTGVGRCITLRFLELNAKVVVWDHSLDKLKKLSLEAALIRPYQGDSAKEEGERNDETCTSEESSCSPSNANLTTSVVDLSDSVHVQRAGKELGQVDIVVNAANVSSTKHFFESPDESTQKILFTNVVAPLVLARVFLPMMFRRQDGHFVTITDMTGLTGDGEHPDYAASQWASIGAHESIQMMIAERGRKRGKLRSTLLCSYGIRSCFKTKSSSSSSMKAATTMTPSPHKPPVEDDVNARSASGRFWASSLLPRQLTPEAVAEACVWAVCYGAERVYIPNSLLFLPLFHILPVRWYVWIQSFFASRGSLATQ